MTTERILRVIERSALGAILALATGLRLYTLGEAEFWFDEIGQLQAGQGSWLNAIKGAAPHAGAAPLDYLITHFMLYTGTDEGILRLPAVLWGVLSVAAVYWLSRRWFGRTTALVVAFVLAISPMHIRYSQELRFYSLGTFAALITVVMFWQAVQRQRWWAWAGFGVVLALSLYAHYYTVFVALALFIWVVIFRRDQFWPFVVSAGLAGLAFVPWVYYDNVVVADRAINMNAVRWEMPTTIARLVISPFVPAAAQLTYLGLDAQPVRWWANAVWICALAGFLWGWFSQRRAKVALPILLTVTTVGGVLLLDIVGRYQFFSRQMVIPAPFLMMAGIGVLADMVRQFGRYRPVTAAVGAVVAAVSLLVLFPSVELVYSSKLTEGTLKQTALYLYRHVGVNDTIVIGGDGKRFFHYLPGLSGQRAQFRWPHLDRDLRSLAQQHERVWLVRWRASAGNRVDAWARAQGAWDITPWASRRGLRAGDEQRSERLPLIYVYSAHDPDAGLKVGIEAMSSPNLAQGQRLALRDTLKAQLEQRDRTRDVAVYLWRWLDVADLPKDTSVDTLREIARDRGAERSEAAQADARYLYRWILQTRPRDWESNYFVARYEMEQGNWAEVVALMGEAIRRDINSQRKVQAYRMLLRGYAHLERTADACRIWRLANNQAADDERIREMTVSMNSWFVTEIGTCEAPGETTAQSGS